MENKSAANQNEGEMGQNEKFEEILNKSHEIKDDQISGDMMKTPAQKQNISVDKFSNVKIA